MAIPVSFAHRARSLRLCAGFEQLAADPVLRLSVGHAAQTRVRDRHSKKSMMRSYFDIFEGVVRKNETSDVSSVG
jgi:hypothetical protein